MPFSLTGEHRGQRIHQSLPEGVCTIGRVASNDLVLPSQTVSRNHAQIRVQGNKAYLTDVDSTNGTRVNGGEPLEPHHAREIFPQDLIEFGSVLLRLTDRETSSIPTWTDESHVSESIHLSREDTGKDALELAAQDSRLLGLVIEAGQFLVDPGDPQETFDRVVELVEKVIPASRILILEKVGDGAPIQRAARVQGARALSPLMLSRTMVRTVIDDGASLLTADAQADDRFKHQQSIVAQDLRSAMAVPLVHNEEILGALYVDTTDPITTYTERDLRVLTLLGQMLGAKIANARLIEVQRERDRLIKELETANTIQRRVLPSALPDIPGYQLRGMQETCEDVGGDLYDGGCTVRGRCQLLLGDVSGKGIGAALLMFAVLGALRVLREEGIPPDRLVEKLDQHLLLTTEPEHYVTLFLAEVDPANHTLEYVNAGHPPAYLVLPDGSLQALESTGVPPGLIDVELPGTKFGMETVDFPPGAVLVVYSDGISEAQRGGKQFGDERLVSVLRECAGMTADDTVSCVISAVESFIGDEPQSDDVTLLVVKRDA